MVEWIYVNTVKIERIAYNAELKIMYIGFLESTIDIPYQGVPAKTFKAFSSAENTDYYYENHIKGHFEQVQIDTENKIDCNLGYS